MQFVEDSIYLEKYYEQFHRRVEGTGFNVFLDHSVDSFFSATNLCCQYFPGTTDEYKFPDSGF